MRILPQVIKTFFVNSINWLQSFLIKIQAPSKHQISFFQVNQPTRCNNFSSLFLDVYVQLNMFRASSRPSPGAQQLQQQPLVLLLERGGSSAVDRGWAGRPDHDQQHCYHHVPTVIPEAATAVVELLVMGVMTPETCWAVRKRQEINLRNCCIWLVDLFEIVWWCTDLQTLNQISCESDKNCQQNLQFIT